jgi:sugar O-acyltransferase (sialic acid O-acetyltransferase NeuD family)
MEKIIVIGAGGHAKVVIDIFNYTGYHVVGVLDGDTSKHGKTLLGVPILGGNEKLEEILASGVKKAFVAIGNNDVRVKIGESLKAKGFTLVTAIHHSAIIADSVRIGEGSMVAAGGVINPDASIGKHVIINTGVTVDHDCVIKDGAHVSPGVNLAGNVQIGEKTHVGIGSCIIQGINISENTVIGAGSVVVRDIASDVVAYGNPAKVKNEIVRQ